METTEKAGLGVLVRKRRSRAEIDRLVFDYNNSGQTQECFARERGLNVGTFRGWLYRRRGNESEDLQEVVLRADASKQSDHGAVVVRTARGVEVELPLCAGSAWIERMVRELARS
jgi:hypothetical protein